MSELFDVAELVKVAVEDEKSGVAFYGALADKCKDLKALFQDLCRQEGRHQQAFEKMLEELGGVTTREEYPGQYMLYLQTLTSGRAFPDAAMAKRQAMLCKSDREALALATQFERDTLILMNEMRALVPDKDRSIVEQLIGEEQGHLVALGEARRKLVG